jgi:Tol biopolymer transport system component
LAFFRRADRVNSLWLADDRGGALRQLSTGSLFEFSQIEWSPDGTSILLSTVVGDRTAAAVVPTDGSAEHIVRIDMPIEGPVWLQSGEILFRGLPQTGAGLFAIRPDGSGQRTIVAPTGALQWDAQFYAPSPDGSEITYQWRPAPTAPMILYVVPAAGGTPRAISSVESVNPVWSPDGTWIAFWGDDGTYIVRADGATPERRATPVRASFRWTPDSSRLLVQDEQQEAVLIDPFGGPDETVSWSAIEFPDWQRLAPTP